MDLLCTGVTSLGDPHTAVLTRLHRGQGAALAVSVHFEGQTALPTGEIPACAEAALDDATEVRVTVTAGARLRCALEVCVCPQKDIVRALLEDIDGTADELQLELAIGPVQRRGPAHGALPGSASEDGCVLTLIFKHPEAALLVRDSVNREAGDPAMMFAAIADVAEWVVNHDGWMKAKSKNVIFSQELSHLSGGPMLEHMGQSPHLQVRTHVLRARRSPRSAFPRDGVLCYST